MTDFLDNFQPNKIYVLNIVNSKDRMLIYNFLEKEYPHIFKSSGYILEYPCESKTFYKCDCGYTIPLKYNYGYLENNSDEFYTGECKKCNFDIILDCCDTWEHNKVFKKFRNVILLSLNEFLFKNKIRDIPHEKEYVLNLISENIKKIVDVKDCKISKKMLKNLVK